MTPDELVRVAKDQRDQMAKVQTEYGLNNPPYVQYEPFPQARPIQRVSMTPRQFQWTLGFWFAVATINGATLGAAVMWLALRGGL